MHKVEYTELKNNFKENFTECEKPYYPNLNNVFETAEKCLDAKLSEVTANYREILTSFTELREKFNVIRSQTKKCIKNASYATLKEHKRNMNLEKNETYCTEKVNLILNKILFFKVHTL